MDMKSHMILLITLISATCLGQNIPDPPGYDTRVSYQELETLTSSGAVRTFDKRYQGIKGTPYVFEDWLPGEVFMKNKQRFIIKELNYNCHANEVAYLDPSSRAVMLINKYGIELFLMKSGADTLVFVQLQLQEDEIPVFAKLLYQGESTLYRVYEKEFIEASYKGAYSADRRYDEFIDKSSFYFSGPDDAFPAKLKQSKKQVLAAFPGAEDKLSAYMKAEKLDLKHEEDLVRLLKYYDSL